MAKQKVKLAISSKILVILAALTALAFFAIVGYSYYNEHQAKERQKRFDQDCTSLSVTSPCKID